MQTFLPLPSFTRSAAVLDRQRLGKQRVECVQILQTLLNQRTAWHNHPAVLMWAGYERALLQYTIAVLDEWNRRGYRNEKVLTMLEPVHSVLKDEPLVMPAWVGRRRFHRSHQSNLLRKNPAHYGVFGWNVPDNLEYVWSVTKDLMNG